MGADRLAFDKVSCRDPANLLSRAKIPCADRSITAARMQQATARNRQRRDWLRVPRKPFPLLARFCVPSNQGDRRDFSLSSDREAANYRAAVGRKNGWRSRSPMVRLDLPKRLFGVNVPGVQRSIETACNGSAAIRRAHEVTDGTVAACKCFRGRGLIDVPHGDAAGSVSEQNTF